MRNVKYVHLCLAMALILSSFSAVSVEAGEPWGWPPESGNDINPEPAGAPSVAETASVSTPVSAGGGVFLESQNSLLIPGDIAPQAKSDGAHGDILWTLWIDLLMQLLH